MSTQSHHIESRYTEGRPVLQPVLSKTSKRQMVAVDFSGRDLPLYALDPPPVQERPPGWEPTLICPDPDCMGRSTARGGPSALQRCSNVGPNNSVYLFCVNPQCGLKWKRSDDMPPGVALEMA